MKKLVVCLCVLGAALAIWLARRNSWSVSMEARELSVISAEIAVEKLQAAGVPIPSSETLETALAWLLRPGAYALAHFGVDPDMRYALILAALFGWWVWGTIPRLIWCAMARILGIADMAHFWVWLLLVPPWRPFYRVWLRIRRWYAHFFTHKGASAAWTSFLGTLTLVYRRGDWVFLGRPLFCGIRVFQQVGLRGALHVLVVAASGSGKTRWLKILLGRLHRKASALVVDCDAELINALGAPLERQGHRVLNLDPFGLSRFPKACWNALDELGHAAIRHGREAVVRYGQRMAGSLIVELNCDQPIFAEVARTFAHGLILFVWLFEPPERRNLVRVRELGANGMPERVVDPKQSGFAVLLQVMKQADQYDDGCGGKITAVIVRAASLMESGERAREGNPFRSTFLAATAWLDSPEMAAISTHSDFACADLKEGNACAFVVAPVIDVRQNLSGWIRLLTDTTWYVFANIPKRLKIPCAFILDETPSLAIPDLDVAAPVARKHGIRLVLVTQDREKMRQTYPKSYMGFWGNAMCVLWMGTEHNENLEVLSDTLGSCMRKERIEGGVLSDVPARYQLVERKLAHPHQLRELLDPARGWMIVTRAGKPPLLLAIETAEKAVPIWAIEADPNFREPFLRAMTRYVLSWLWPRKAPQGPGASSTGRPPTAVKVPPPDGQIAA